MHLSVMTSTNLLTRKQSFCISVNQHLNLEWDNYLTARTSKLRMMHQKEGLRVRTHPRRRQKMIVMSAQRKKTRANAHAQIYGTLILNRNINVNGYQNALGLLRNRDSLSDLPWQ